MPPTSINIYPALPAATAGLNLIKSKETDPIAALLEAANKNPDNPDTQTKLEILCAIALSENESNYAIKPSANLALKIGIGYLALLYEADIGILGEAKDRAKLCENARKYLAIASTHTATKKLGSYYLTKADFTTGSDRYHQAGVLIHQAATAREDGNTAQATKLLNQADKLMKEALSTKPNQFAYQLRKADIQWGLDNASGAQEIYLAVAHRDRQDLYSLWRLAQTYSFLRQSSNLNSTCRQIERRETTQPAKPLFIQGCERLTNDSFRMGSEGL